MFILFFNRRRLTAIHRRPSFEIWHLKLIQRFWGDKMEARWFKMAPKGYIWEAPSTIWLIGEVFGALGGAFWGPWRDIWTPGGHLGEHFWGFRDAFGDLGGPFGLIWGALGLIWEAFGLIWEAFGVVWEASVDHLGSFSELWRLYFEPSGKLFKP